MWWQMLGEYIIFLGNIYTLKEPEGIAPQIYISSQLFAWVKSVSVCVSDVFKG